MGRVLPLLLEGDCAGQSVSQGVLQRVGFWGEEDWL